MVMLIADAVNQVGPDEEQVLAIYLSKADGSPKPNEDGLIDPLDGATSLTYVENVPFRKLAVNPASDGTYLASYGPILNPVERNYATGSLDPTADIRTLFCDPEPKHAKWQYWESELSDSEFLPEYRCVMVHGQCWVVEVDAPRGSHWPSKWPDWT